MFEISPRRRAIFYYFTVFKNMTKRYPKTSEKYPKILQHSHKKYPEINPNNNLKPITLLVEIYLQNDAKRRPLERIIYPTSVSEPTYDPKAPPEHQNVRRSDFEAPTINEKVLPKDHCSVKNETKNQTHQANQTHQTKQDTLT